MPLAFYRAYQKPFYAEEITTICGAYGLSLFAAGRKSTCSVVQ